VDHQEGRRKKTDNGPDEIYETDCRISLFDHRRNTDILNELNIDPIVCYIQQYTTQWEKHVERMDPDRKPK
jgi:hypothetical protein